MTLATKRDKAARAALRAHHDGKNTPRQRVEGRALYTLEGNPDLTGDFVDLIADSLSLAGTLGLDAAAIARMALSHVPAAS